MCTDMKATCSGRPLQCSLQEHTYLRTHITLEAVVSWELCH